MKVFSHSITDVLWILWPSGLGWEQEMKNEELRGVLFRICLKKRSLEREKLSTPFHSLSPGYTNRGALSLFFFDLRYRGVTDHKTHSFDRITVFESWIRSFLGSAKGVRVKFKNVAAMSGVAMNITIS